MDTKWVHIVPVTRCPFQSRPRPRTKACTLARRWSSKSPALAHHVRGRRLTAGRRQGRGGSAPWSRRTTAAPVDSIVASEAIVVAVVVVIVVVVAAAAATAPAAAVVAIAVAVAVAAATTIAATAAVVDCYVFLTPLLDFDGAVRRRHHP